MHKNHVDGYVSQRNRKEHNNKENIDIFDNDGTN